MLTTTFAPEFRFQIPEQPVNPQAADITIRELIDAYLEHCQIKFRKYGRQTGGYANAKMVMRLLLASGAGPLPLAYFGPVWLDQFRTWLASEPSRRWARRTIARYTWQVTCMVKWAVSQQLTTPDHHQALLTLDPLRRGRSLKWSGASLRDGKRVTPVDPADLDKVLPHCSPMLADMIRLQWMTAMRPSEVVAIRRCDIRASVNHGCHEYAVQVSVNKMEHEDRERVVLLGDKAMEIVSRWCSPKITGYVFSPRRAVALEYERRAANKKQTRYDYQDPTLRLERRRDEGVSPRKLGACYTTDSYRRAIERACERAGVPPFAPNRIRHTAATTIASNTEIAVAREILGHADLRTTQRYVGTLRNKAAEYIKTHG